MSISLQQYYDELIRAAGDGTFPGTMSEENNYCTMRRVRENKTVAKCAIGIRLPEHVLDQLEEDELLHEEVTEIDEAIITKYFPTELSLEDISDIQSSHDTASEFGWDRSKFIHMINGLGCFDGVEKYTSDL
ncbi:MAG: hypothetical protein ACR2QC_08100 [Gammaproteobacteria bacterium]